MTTLITGASGFVGSAVLRRLLAEGHRVEVTLDRTPFYAEGGGQVGDRGEIRWPDPSASSGRAVFKVEDTQHVGEGGLIVHVGRLESGTLSIGDPVDAQVDESLRADTMRNHTGTHILHAALRKVLGTHVRQAGSLVTPDRLRFDFTHLEALTPAQLREVERAAVGDLRFVRAILRQPFHGDHRAEERNEDGPPGIDATALHRVAVAELVHEDEQHESDAEPDARALRLEGNHGDHGEAREKELPERHGLEEHEQGLALREDQQKDGAERASQESFLHETLARDFPEASFVAAGG